MRLAIPLLALLLVAALPAAAKPPAKDLVYGAPVKSADWVVTPVQFVSPNGDKVAGEIYQPARHKPRGGVLFVHWLGDPKTTNHSEFEADAAALAREGVTSLLVDAMWSRPGWISTMGKSAADDAKATNDQVADLQASLNVLADQAGVDARRQAVVGHDFGAMTAALLAGRDPRVAALVLAAGNSDLAEWYAYGKVAPPGYAEALGISVTETLKASKARAVLFQFARVDRYIPPNRAAAFAAASPVPPTILTYPGDHSLAVPQAAADRQAWLLKALK
jgi:dienelactone hydrolase